MMRIKNFIKSNYFLKPTAVVMETIIPLSYLLTQTKLFNYQVYQDDMVLININIISGLAKVLTMSLVLVSIMEVYKPNKAVTAAIVTGVVLIGAGALLEIIGFTLVLFGVGVTLKNVTIGKYINRNELLKVSEEEKLIGRVLNG